MQKTYPDRLTQFALNTLEEAVTEASAKAKVVDASPMRRTWGIRLALAYLASKGVGERWLYDNFWDELVDPHESQSASTASYIRFTNLNTICGRFHQLLNVKRAGAPVIGSKRRDDDKWAEHNRILAATQGRAASED